MTGQVVVVDASVAIKWFVRGDWAAREDHVDTALALLRAIWAGRVVMHQPPHFAAEVAAVLARLDPPQVVHNAEHLNRMDIRYAAPTEHLNTALDLSLRLNHHLFDTLYHAVALDTPEALFITADRRYFDKAASRGRIVWLPDWVDEADDQTSH